MKKKNKYIIVFIILVIAIGTLVYFSGKKYAQNTNISVNYEQIDSREYFLNFNEKYGVIDKYGNEIINAKYDVIQIPNPQKDVFICMNNYNTESGEYNTRVYNKEKEEILWNYSKVEAIKREESTDGIPYEKTVLKYKENGKYGLIDFEGKKITKPLYSSITALEFKEGMLLVSLNSKYGIININGKEVIPAKYDLIESDQYSISENHNEKAGFIVANKKENQYAYGYINSNAKKVLNTEYSEIKRINNIQDDENTYLVVIKNGNAGLLKNDKTILKCEYEDIQFDSLNNLLIVSKQSKQGICKLNGEEVIPVKFENIIIVGSSINAQIGNEVIVFDKNGKPFSDENLISIMKKNEYYITIDKNEKYGVLDSNTNKIIDNKYDYLEYINNDFFIAQSGDETEIIDSKENVILTPKYDVINAIHGTDLIQAIVDKRVDILNMKMEKVVSMDNAQVSIKDGYIKIYNDKDRKYFYYNGKEASSQEVIKNGKLFANKDENKWGFVNEKGQKIVENTYDFVTEFNKYGYAGIKKDGKWGVINQEGKVIQNPIYELSSIEPDFIGKYYSVDLGYGEIFYCANIINN